jgi:hypothetical protein
MTLSQASGKSPTGSLREVAHRKVSAFVAAAVRNELDRWRLPAFVQELVDELGPLDEAEVARCGEMLAATAAASDAIRPSGAGSWVKTGNWLPVPDNLPLSSRFAGPLIWSWR